MLLRAKDNAVHSIAGVLLHLNCTVCVDVHGSAYVRVTHAVLHCLHINTLFDECGTVTMSQIVESDVSESSRIGESLPLALPCLWMIGLAVPLTDNASFILEQHSSL